MSSYIQNNSAAFSKPKHNKYKQVKRIEYIQWKDILWTHAMAIIVIKWDFA